MTGIRYPWPHAELLRQTNSQPQICFQYDQTKSPTTGTMKRTMRGVRIRFQSHSPRGPVRPAGPAPMALAVRASAKPDPLWRSPQTISIPPAAAPPAPLPS